MIEKTHALITTRTNAEVSEPGHRVARLLAKVNKCSSGGLISGEDAAKRVQCWKRK